MQDNRREPVPIFDSVLHTLEHTVAGRPYTLSVWLPPQYAETSEAYPVIYVLDASTLFGMATSTAFALGLYHEIPDVILVGIGVPMCRYDDSGAHRDRDFTPTVVPDDRNPTGEAPLFLQVLRTDVIPFIDAHYRTTPQDRTLFGHSLAGLFVAYAYLQAPGLFHRYVAAHAWTLMTGWCSRWLVLSAGEYESGFRATNDAFAQMLRELTADSVRIRVLVFDGETHASGIARAYVHGLKAAFAG